MKYKKYIIIIITIIFVLITCIVIFIHKTPIHIEGTLLLHMTYNGKDTIGIYDCSKREFHDLSLGGLQARFFDDDTILINDFDIITKYDVNSKDKTILYHGDAFEYFTSVSGRYLSITKDNCIFLYDIYTKENNILVQDVGSKIHSWSKTGDVLYYSNVNNKVVAYDVLAGEINEIGVGYDPIVRGSYIAYKDKDELFVKDMRTNKEYKYCGSSYSYCFSPDGSRIIIEDEMTIGTAVKNFITKDIVLGHRLVIWDYKSNQSNTIIDSCLSTPNMICDWK